MQDIVFFKRANTLLTILLGLALLAAGAAYAFGDDPIHTQPDESSEPIQNQTPEESSSTTRKTWNLRNADIRAVIGEVSRVTGKNFLIDSRVQGTISIISGTAISDKELYAVFLSMLQVSGYAAVPTGNVTKIIPNAEARTQSADLLSSMKHPPQGDDMVVQVVPVHYVSAEQLVPVLRPLMPQWSIISAYAPSNMLILSGRANHVKNLTHIIKEVDSSTSNGIDIVPLEHALAMDISGTLKELLKQPQQSMGSRQQTMIAPDDRSNSILISGTKTERIRLRWLIHQLDRKSPDAGSSNTQVVYLSYLRAEDAAPILAGVAQASFSGNVGVTIGTITRPPLDSTNPASNIAGYSINNAQQVLEQAEGTHGNSNASNTKSEGTTKPTVQIIAEPNTNSIIINAPPSLIRMLKSVVSQLDIKPAQLLVEALVAEINEDDFNSLGIEWGSINQETLSSGSFQPGFAIVNAKSTIEQLQAQIYALAKEKKANILSTPSVVVLDNRQAKILIGKQVSIATSSYPNNAGGTTTASPFTTYDRVNVALHLYVKPQITRSGGIQMQLDEGHDTLDSNNSLFQSPTPTFNISAIVTSVHVQSGDTVILGGLRQDTLGNDNTKVPILGDIPGVGRLFQHNITSHEKKVLMVFIRPKILQTDQDSLNITGSKYNDIRQQELHFIREQERFEERNAKTVMPPLHTATLPRPFAHPTPLKNVTK